VALVVLTTVPRLLADGVTWWVIAPPVAQATAQVAVAAAVSLWAIRRALSDAVALTLAHALALLACLTMAPVVAALMVWLTGWAAVLPDPEIPGWVVGGVAPALWLLVAAAVVACAAFRRSGVQAFGRSGVGDELLAPMEHSSFDLNTRTPERLNARTPERLNAALNRAVPWIAGLLAAWVLLLPVRHMIGVMEGQANPRSRRWGARFVMLRLVGDPEAVPYDLRDAFRNFGSGDYRQALESARRWSYDVLLEDDRRLLKAACLLSLGDLRGARTTVGAVRCQYQAALAVRAAAALQGGEIPQSHASAVAAAFAAPLSEPDGARLEEAAALERLIPALDDAEYRVYAARQRNYLSIPYRLFPRPGHVALRIALLRRLAALRPRDDRVLVELAQELTTRERLLTNVVRRGAMQRAHASLLAQRQQLCRQALAVNPRNTDAMVLIGRLDEAIVAQPNDAHLRRLRIRRALDTGDTARLVEDARQLCALTRNDTESRFMLALAEVRAGETAAGLEDLRSLIESFVLQRASGAALPAEAAHWVLDYALLSSQAGQLAEAQSVLERATAGGAAGKRDGTRAPMDPAVLLGLLRLAAGDERGALAVVRRSSAPETLLPVLIEVQVRRPSRAYVIRRLNRLQEGGASVRSLPSWTDEGLRFDLEAVARTILRRDPHSLVGRYLLADALTARVPPQNLVLASERQPAPPSATAREALGLLHSLSQDYPGWVAPYDRIASLCSRFGKFEWTAAYQRLIGDLYADDDPTRWAWRGPLTLQRPGGPGWLR
jgi:hypothetical protein